MKRSPALAPLSREHHEALVVARGLQRADTKSADGAAARFVEFLSEHELAHFLLEETILLPALPDCEEANALAQRVLEEHARLRAVADQLEQRRDNVSIELLRETGALLRSHVRMEERDLFPFIERRLEPNALQDIATRLGAA